MAHQQLAIPISHPSLYSPTTPAGQATYTNMTPVAAFAPNGYVATGARSQRSAFEQTFQYKFSPFYEIKARIGALKTCDGMLNAQYRHFHHANTSGSHDTA